MEGLDFGNILNSQEIEDLFGETDTTSTQKETEVPNETEETKVTEKEDTTEVESSEELFEDQLGSVGSEEKNKEEEGVTSTQEDGTSPNFYSSIATAMGEDGIFPNLDEEVIKKATTAEDLSNLIEEEVKARFTEKERRISKALEDGVEPDDIRRYEAVIKKVNSISDAMLSEESAEGENLRKQVIFQDFLNKGYTAEKAQKLTERIVDAGTDIEDAKDALEGNKEYFQSEYNKLLKEAEKKADEARKERQKQSENLKKTIMEEDNIFGDMTIAKDLRKKIYDNISRPIYKDPETGEYYTALQKYEMEHRTEFLKYAGIMYTLTNGFKDFDSFTKDKVKKEVKKGLRELEKTLNNTRRTSDGSLKMVTTAKDDPESFIGSNFKLAL